MIMHVWYRIEPDGRAPGKVLLPGSDYTRGPVLSAPSLVDLQILLNKPPAPPPEPSSRWASRKQHRGGARPAAAPVARDDILDDEVAEANRQPLWVGDVVIIEEEKRAMVLTPEMAWARTDATVEDEDDGLDAGEFDDED